MICNQLKTKKPPQIKVDTKRVRNWEKKKRRTLVFVGYGSNHINKKVRKKDWNIVPTIL